MTSREVAIRERATDKLGVVHQVAWTNHAAVDTVCDIIAWWLDLIPKNSDRYNRTLTWDGLNPKPDVTCMTCLVKDA